MPQINAVTYPSNFDQEPPNPPPPKNKKLKKKSNGYLLQFWPAQNHLRQLHLVFFSKVYNRLSESEETSICLNFLHLTQIIVLLPWRNFHHIKNFRQISAQQTVADILCSHINGTLLQERILLGIRIRVSIIKEMHSFLQQYTYISETYSNDKWPVLILRCCRLMPDSRCLGNGLSSSLLSRKEESRFGWNHLLMVIPFTRIFPYDSFPW